MTNNQLTDEQIAQLLGDACMVIGDRFATVDELSAAKAIRALAVELQERRKAGSEPVAEVVSIYGDPEAFGEREIRPLVGIQQMPYGTKLYRHAQPAPVVPEEMTIRDACKFVQDMRLFDDVSVIVMRTWNACRAAMLQAGNSPVIPDGSFSGLFNSARALLDALYEFGPDEIAISEHATNLEDALRNAAAPQPQNAPQNIPEIIPGWIPVSERVPTKQDGSVFLTWNGQYIGKELFLMGSFQCLKPEIITHWMPLPTAPQEVK